MDFRTVPFLLALLLFSQSCSESSKSERVATTFSAQSSPLAQGWTLVTGTGPGDPTFNAGQSETVIAVSAVSANNSIATITYNDDTGNGNVLQYTPTTRRVFPGVTELGWSWVQYDPTQSGGAGIGAWTYGGRVQAPAGWPILWGDPGITTSQANPNYKFISSLAVPASKVPSSGFIDGPLESGCFSNIGGACIAVSSDGGKTFAIDAPGGVAQCLTDNNDFYDGSSMASLADGSIYAAFLHIQDQLTLASNQQSVCVDNIDVWRAASETSPFVMLPDPFPGSLIQTHPRLRVAPGGNVLYVAAQDAIGNVMMNQWNGSAWGTPATVAQGGGAGGTGVMGALEYPNINPGGSSTGQILRNGPTFSFDVGTPSTNGDDAIRLVYTYEDASGFAHLAAVRCTLQLKCVLAPEWGTDPNGAMPTWQQQSFDQNEDEEWAPAVAYTPGPDPTNPMWAVSFYQSFARSGTQNVTLGGYFLDVVNGTRGRNAAGSLGEVELPFPTQTPCSDQRGYWGDYNDMRVASSTAVDPISGKVVPYFFVTGTDSTPSCSFQWAFTSSPVHVGVQVLGRGF